MRSSWSAVAVVLSLSCSDTPSRPPPPPRPDAGRDWDAAIEPDAAVSTDASVDPDAGPGSTTIRRDYGTDVDVCSFPQIPLWGDLRWTARIPDGASIRFTAQAAAAGDSLSGAPRATLGTTPPDAPPLYVADELLPEHRNDPQLRISAQLRWSSPDQQPTLDSLSLDWVCLDPE